MCRSCAGHCTGTESAAHPCLPALLPFTAKNLPFSGAYLRTAPQYPMMESSKGGRHPGKPGPNRTDGNRAGPSRDSLNLQCLSIGTVSANKPDAGTPRKGRGMGDSMPTHGQPSRPTRVQIPRTLKTGYADRLGAGSAQRRSHEHADGFPTDAQRD